MPPTKGTEEGRLELDGFLPTDVMITGITSGAQEPSKQGFFCGEVRHRPHRIMRFTLQWRWVKALGHKSGHLVVAGNFYP